MKTVPFLLLFMITQSQAAELGQSIITEVQGKNALIEGKPAKKGSIIHSNDLIETGDNTSLKIKLGAKEAALLVKPKSALKIDHSNKNGWELSITHGSILSTIRKDTQHPIHFNLRTKAATLGVRGTTFFVREEENQPTFFCPCNGEIEMMSPDQKSKKTFISKHHDQPELIDIGSEAVEKRIASPPKDFDIGHSDEEIEDLKKIID